MYKLGFDAKISNDLVMKVPSAAIPAKVCKDSEHGSKYIDKKISNRLSTNVKPDHYNVNKYSE